MSSVLSNRNLKKCDQTNFKLAMHKKIVHEHNGSHHSWHELRITIILSDFLFLQLQPVVRDWASVRVSQQHPQSQEEWRHHETLERVSVGVKNELSVPKWLQFRSANLKTASSSHLCTAGSWQSPAAVAPRALIPSPLTTHTSDRTKVVGETAVTPWASPPSAPVVQTWKTSTPASCLTLQMDTRER